MLEENKAKTPKRTKKSKIILVAIIMVIVGLLIGICGSYYYLEVYSKEKCVKPLESTKKTKVEIKNLDVLSNIVLDNFTKIMQATGRCDDIAREYFKSSKVTVSDLKKDLVFSVIDTSFINKETSISATEYESKAKEYFGADYKYEHEDFSQKMCTNHRYNKDTNSYDYVQTACGCTTGPNSSILYRISKAELSDNFMELTVKVLFPSTDFDNEGHAKYYSDVNRTKEIPGLWYHYSENPNDAEIIDNDDAYKKGGTYIVTMKKYKDDIYSFVSIEPID